MLGGDHGSDDQPGHKHIATRVATVEVWGRTRLRSASATLHRFWSKSKLEQHLQLRSVSHHTPESLGWPHSNSACVPLGPAARLDVAGWLRRLVGLRRVHAVDAVWQVDLPVNHGPAQQHEPLHNHVQARP
eukprot:365213-Chlamydomonas_euryale.AAC.19